MSGVCMKVRRTTDLEIPGLGRKIKLAREADTRSLETICREVQLSRVYWYDIESERIRGALPEETLRRIEEVLGVDLGVEF